MVNAHDAKAGALLLDHHASVKAQDSWGQTPLHHAVSSRWDHSDSVGLLLAHGADVNARDRDGDTPFLLAGNARDIETLVAHGADTKVRDKDGQTALHRAARSPNNLFSDLDVLAELCACSPNAAQLGIVNVRPDRSYRYNYTLRMTLWPSSRATSNMTMPTAAIRRATSRKCGTLLCSGTRTAAAA
jgi:hypothetical protein